MSRRSANFLRVFAAWTIFVWVTFIRNISRDHTHSTGFKTVHITLAVISLVFAVGAFVVVSRTRRAAGQSGEPDPAAPANAPGPAEWDLPAPSPRSPAR